MGALSGFTIALPENRQLDLLASMVEEQGATAIRCPLVSILDSAHPDAVRAWLDEFIARPFDDTIFYTGEGIRRLAAFATTAGKSDAFIAAMSRTRRITRGPKPVRALRELGLEPIIQASAPTTDGLMETLKGESLSGHRIGVQLFGEDPGEKLIAFLRSVGATVHPVAPYRYASAAEDDGVVALIERLAAGTIDLIAFTSASQLERLEEVAEKKNLSDQLRSGLARVKIAAVGPVVAAALEERGLRVAAMPERSFTLKPLVRAIADALNAPDHNE